MSLFWASIQGAKTYPTASEKLRMLRPHAVLRLFTAHMIMRATQERLDPGELREAAHQLLELASQSERQTARENRK